MPFVLKGLAVLATCLVPRLSHALLNTTWSKTDLTAQTYPRGKTGALVLQINASNPDVNAQTVTSITVTRVNGADTDLSSVHLYLDNGDNSFSTSSDTEIGTAGAFSGGTKAFGGLSVNIPALTGSKTFFVTYDFSTSATHGATLSAKINATSDIAQNPDGVAGTFPLSSLGTAAASGHTVNTTLTFNQTAQPSGGKARSSITVPYTVTYSDGSAVSAFTTDPTIKLRTGSTDATATLVWEAVNAAAGQWRVRWTVPNLQTTGSDYKFVISAGSGTAAGNNGPASVASTSTLTVDTQLLFQVATQPVTAAAGDSAVADFTATVSLDNAKVTQFDSAPTTPFWWRPIPERGR